jgi:hypothetical protein
MKDEEPLDEFLADFGGPVPSEEDLESILNRPERLRITLFAWW